VPQFQPHVDGLPPGVCLVRDSAESGTVVRDVVELVLNRIVPSGPVLKPSVPDIATDLAVN
jgi:hypothetical protein